MKRKKNICRIKFFDRGVVSEEIEFENLSNILEFS